MNKEVLKYCPNYYRIVNHNFQDDDNISDKLISIYKNYVFSINCSNSDEIEKVSELDKVLGNYVNDLLFRNTLQKEIVRVRVNRDNNILRNLVDIILRIFSKYEEDTTRKIYVSKWI